MQYANLISLNSISLIHSAEWMARRVLTDFEHANLSKRQLARAYKIDMQLGSLTYDNLMKLGQLLEELAESAKTIEIS